MPGVSDWSGPYLGAQLGYDWGRTRVLDNGVLTEPGARTNGALGGALAGYNWQNGLFVFGIELTSRLRPSVAADLWRHLLPRQTNMW